MKKPKLTEDQLAEKKAQQQQDRVAQLLQTSLRELREEQFVPKNPTRTFAVGDRVHFGAHSNTKVLEVLDDNTIYRIRNYQNIPAKEDNSHFSDLYVSWLQLESYRTPEENSKLPVFGKKDEFNIQYMQQGIESLLYRVYKRGVEFDAPYQREAVWTLADKVSLIDSIFNNIEIGKFVLIKVWQESGRTHNKDFEVLDGKQRITALTEFYEGRFPYKGLTYDMLSRQDQNRFLDSMVAVAEIGQLTFEKKCEYFLRLNTAGKPQSEVHLNKVRDMLKNAKPEFLPLD